MKRFGLLLLLFVLLPAQVKAQTYSSENIQSFESNIRIDQNSVAHISETIVYNYGTDAVNKHGTFRFVPIKTQAEGTDKFYYYNVEWGEVLQDGQPATIQEEDTGEYRSIRIGNPNETVTGQHTYKINYTLSPVVEQDPEGYFINLNIVGKDWEVPIYNMSANITLDNGSTISETRCYSGYVGSTDQTGCIAAHKGNSATFKSEYLSAYSSATVNILAEGGSFSTYLTAQDPPPTNPLAFSPFVIGIFALLAGFGIKIYYWLSQRQKKRNKTIIPQYEPPTDLSVAEIGLIHDNKSDMKEVTATLIDLAVRGYIKISQVPDRSSPEKVEYHFDRLMPANGLAKHEQKLYDLLFGQNKTSIYLNDIPKIQAGDTINGVKKSLVTSLESKHLRIKEQMDSSQAIINIFFGVMFLLIIGITFAYMLLTTARETSNDHVWIYAFFGLLALGVGYGLSITIYVTDAGYEKWAQIEGLLMYLTVAEKDRLAFHNAPEKTPEHFSALLPAAIALGVDNQWAEQFKDLDMSQSVDWYSSNTPGFNSVILANSLSSDFGRTVSSSFTPPSQSSSGFSGGGFSGGGGGGGGGGSW